VPVASGVKGASDIRKNAPQNRRKGEIAIQRSGQGAVCCSGRNPIDLLSKKPEDEYILAETKEGATALEDTFPRRF